MNLNELKKMSMFLQGLNYDAVAWELDDFSRLIAGYEKMSRGYSDYGFVRCIHLSKEVDIGPIFKSFLKYVRDCSKEAYLFVTDGHDIMNLKEYLAFSKLERKEIIKKLEELNSHAKYLQYIVLKIMKEKREEERLAMLAGLLGERIIK